MGILEWLIVSNDQGRLTLYDTLSHNNAKTLFNRTSKYLKELKEKKILKALDVALKPDPEWVTFNHKFINSI